jgi:hypothetical protein
MRDTIMNTDGLFGTYPGSAEDGQLFLGDTQSMQFKPSDREDRITFQAKRERETMTQSPNR